MTCLRGPGDSFNWLKIVYMSGWKLGLKIEFIIFGSNCEVMRLWYYLRMRIGIAIMDPLLLGFVCDG